MNSDLFDFGKTINSFRGKHGFLSNLFDCRFTIWDTEFPSAEHAYQWAKTLDPIEKDHILWWDVMQTAYTPGTLCKSRGKTVTLRPDWETIQENGNILAYNTMLEICRAKFTQNVELGQRLLDTDDARLIEGNYWHDRRWGVCDCEKCDKKENLNWLGVILMQVRDELK